MLSELLGLGPLPKGVNCNFSSPGIRQALGRLKAIHLGRLNMQFQQDWPKDTKITALSIFWWTT